MTNINTPCPNSPKNPIQMQDVHQIVKDLFKPRADIFWSDLLLSATVGWGAFIVACLAVPLSGQMWSAIIIAAIAFYRCLVFIHELTHLRVNALPGFSLVWNLLVGIPLLLPSFTYTGVHTDHHRLGSYGTAQDPEYMPFAGKKGSIIFFVAHSFLLPVLIALRFLVLSPLAILLPPFHRFLEIHASSLSMNLSYRRRVSKPERSSMIALELLILGIWAVPIALAIYGILPWRVFVIWYAVMALVMVTNSMRTLGAHRYRSNGEPMTLDNQLLDSVDVPGAPWTVIWAPVGLRYHALHHYFPSMPYHNLSIAHQRLIASLPSDATYCRSISSSLWDSLKNLWRGSSVQ